MRKCLQAVGAIAILSWPATALATPVNFATFLSVGVTGAPDVLMQGFGSPFLSGANSAAGVSASVQIDLTSATLKASNQNTSASLGLGAGTNAILYDTLTFNQAGFTGQFSSGYTLNLNATFDGTNSVSGPVSSAGTGGRIHVYSGNTVIDSGAFTDVNSLINFMFVNGPTPLCANGVNGPDLSTHNGSFSFNVSCQVQVTPANPTVKILMSLPTFFNGSGGTWSLDMTHSATLSANFGPFQVTSASGAFPGTAAPVPEPGTFGLLGLGLVALGRMVRRRRS